MRLTQQLRNWPCTSVSNRNLCTTLRRSYHYGILVTDQVTRVIRDGTHRMSLIYCTGPAPKPEPMDAKPFTSQLKEECEP